MRLSAGARAPDFTGELHTGATWSTSAARGAKLWLAFFRYTSCMFCNFRIHEVVARYDDLSARGLRFVGVFQSPRAPLAEFAAQQPRPLPLLSDPAERLYALYGLETSLAGYLSPRNLPGLVKGVGQGYSLVQGHGSRTRLPADFLIDESGTIHTASYGRAISDSLAWADVEAFMGMRS